MRNPTGSTQFVDEGLRHIPRPFWADLPHANIFTCITPDLLHQLHKGVFKDHLVKWVSIGLEDELDARMARMPPYQGVRTPHLQKGDFRHLAVDRERILIARWSASSWALFAAGLQMRLEFWQARARSLASSSSCTAIAFDHLPLSSLRCPINLPPQQRRLRRPRHPPPLQHSQALLARSLPPVNYQHWRM